MAKIATTGVRLLVLEDDEDSREMLLEFAKLFGVLAQGARDAKEAYEHVRTFAPTVAILDLGLPDGDGMDVAKRLRKCSGQRLKLVALTGSGEKETRRQALAAGFDEFLVKPLDTKQLQRLLTP